MEKLIENSIDRLSKRVRKERKLQGLSQTELGHLAGVSLNFLSQLEQGKPTVRMDKLLAVLIVLGIEFKINYGRQGVSE